MDSNDLGQTLRHWRDRVSPENAGVAVGGRRRATGLRREELAGLAGISVDYLTRLEQGRASSPSAQVLEALARGLRLSDPERSLLFQLASQSAPGVGIVSSRIPPSVQRLLDRLQGNPIVVYDAMWNLIVANDPYDALMGATANWRGSERNAVWRNVFGLGSRVVHTDAEHAELVAGLVGDLRMTAARYPSDRRLNKLVGDLQRQSTGFRELWQRADIPLREDRSRQKVIDHPLVGLITVDCDTLVVAGDDLRIMVYSAQPQTPDAERLALAIVMGTQSLVD